MSSCLCNIVNRLLETQVEEEKMEYNIVILGLTLCILQNDS